MANALYTRDRTPASDRRRSLELTARVAMVLLIAGGVMVWSGIGSTDPSSEARDVRLYAGLALIAVGASLPLLPSGSPRMYAGIYASVGVLVGLLAFLEPIAMVPLFFIWPVVYTGWFGSRRELATLLGVTAVGVAVAVNVNASIELKLDAAVGIVLSAGLIGGIANYLRSREDGLRAELEDAAATDPLTGLANRRALNASLGTLLADAEQGAGDLAFILFDVDHFKHFNDTHGHVAGDVALQRFAAVLAEAAGTGRLVARFGGEEFVVVLPGEGHAGAQRVVARVSMALATEPVDHDRRLTVSAGISELGDPEVTSFDRLVSRADAALYAAKAAGRARPAWWDHGQLRIGTPGPGHLPAAS